MIEVRRLCLCGLTDIGRNRARNEDSYLVIDRDNEKYDTYSRGTLFAVADGLGGHRAGEIASRMACEGLTAYYTEPLAGGLADSPDAPDPDVLLDHLTGTFRKIHTAIYSYGRKNRECSGLGTTLSTLVILKTRALVAHVGDSRIYRLRGETLEQLTVDDTLARESAEQGESLREVAWANVLTQAVGVDMDTVHTQVLDIQDEDAFLLCSDGLYNMISDDDIGGVISRYRDSGVVCDLLVREALERGGMDNVTILLIRV